MPGDNNFLQFDPNKQLILNDADYLNALSRLNGVSAGQASAALHNKLFYQMSTFVSAFAKAISDAGFDAVDTDFNNLVASIAQYSNIEKNYPIGSVYINASDDTNPEELLGFGTWIAFASGRMLTGVSADFAIGATGGEKEHVLTIDEMPTHSHNSQYDNRTPGDIDGGGAGEIGGMGDIRTYPTTETGGNDAHNNMPPYIVVYMWKRTAYFTSYK
jgi:hypothetical protein